MVDRSVVEWSRVVDRCEERNKIERASIPSILFLPNLSCTQYKHITERTNNHRRETFALHVRTGSIQSQYFKRMRMDFFFVCVFQKKKLTRAWYGKFQRLYLRDWRKMRQMGFDWAIVYEHRGRNCSAKKHLFFFICPVDTKQTRHSLTRMAHPEKVINNYSTSLCKVKSKRDFV